MQKIGILDELNMAVESKEKKKKLKKIKVENLTEIIGAHIFDEPKWMIVCNDDIEDWHVKKVCAILPRLSHGVVCAFYHYYKRAFLIPDYKYGPEEVINDK